MEIVLAGVVLADGGAVVLVLVRGVVGVEAALEDSLEGGEVEVGLLSGCSNPDPLPPSTGCCLQAIAVVVVSVASAPPAPSADWRTHSMWVKPQSGSQAAMSTLASSRHDSSESDAPAKMMPLHPGWASHAASHLATDTRCFLVRFGPPGSTSAPLPLEHWKYPQYSQEEFDKTSPGSEPAPATFVVPLEVLASIGAEAKTFALGDDAFVADVFCVLLPSHQASPPHSVQLPWELPHATPANALALGKHRLHTSEEGSPTCTAAAMQQKSPEDSSDVGGAAVGTPLGSAVGAGSGLDVGLADGAAATADSEAFFSPLCSIAAQPSGGWCSQHQLFLACDHPLIQLLEPAWQSYGKEVVV